VLIYMVYVKYYDSKKGIYAHTVRKNAGGEERAFKTIRTLNLPCSTQTAHIHDTKLHE